MLMHFYVYNECYKPLSATVEYIPLGNEVAVSATVAVTPGNQTMLCTTERNSIEVEAVSDDGTLHWARQSFSLTEPDYTHVMTCECRGPNCPNIWPLDTSRQQPKEES